MQIVGEQYAEPKCYEQNFDFRYADSVRSRPFLPNPDPDLSHRIRPDPSCAIKTIFLWQTCQQNYWTNFSISNLKDCSVLKDKK